MKQFFTGALLISYLSFPASATSIELIDDMVTGPKGKSSIVTLGPVPTCAETACVDGTGGATALKTGSAFSQIAIATTTAKKINFEFARKFPDPASPVPTAPAEQDAGNSDMTKMPKPPADMGTIPAQPPVGGSAPASPAAIGAPVAGAEVDQTRGTIDPAKAPAAPLVNSELRESD